MSIESRTVIEVSCDSCGNWIESEEFYNEQLDYTDIHEIGTNLAESFGGVTNLEVGYDVVEVVCNSCQSEIHEYCTWCKGYSPPTWYEDGEIAFCGDHEINRESHYDCLIEYHESLAEEYPEYFFEELDEYGDRILICRDCEIGIEKSGNLTVIEDQVAPIINLKVGV